MRTPAWLTRIGADPRDDEDLRQKKSLLVLLAVLVLPVSIIWGTCYLAFGSPIGIIPFLTTQLLDILLTTTVGQLFAGGFLPAGGVGLWGILAPLGALVFLEVRQAIRWFVGFVCAFVLLGIAGELFFPPAPVPHWFTTTMLALNIVGAGTIAFIVLASFANERNSALTALRQEQARSEALLTNVLPEPIAERLKGTSGSIADHIDEASVLFADIVDFTPLAQRLSPTEVVDTLDRLFSLFDALVERHGLEKIKTIGDCYMAAAGVPDPCADHASRAALLALDMREAVTASATDGPLELRIG